MSNGEFLNKTETENSEITIPNNKGEVCKVYLEEEP